MYLLELQLEKRQVDSDSPPNETTQGQGYFMNAAAFEVDWTVVDLGGARDSSARAVRANPSRWHLT